MIWKISFIIILAWQCAFLYVIYKRTATLNEALEEILRQQGYLKSYLYGIKVKMLNEEPSRKA